MKSFLKEENYKTPVDNVYNYLQESESATYYDELFSDMPDRSDVPDLFKQVKEKTREEGTAYKVMDEIVSFLEKQLDKNAVVIEIGGGRYQQRSANAYKRFANYFPLDISYSSIKKYTENFNKEGFVADATNLPFKSNSIDCIFTHTFLEHPLDPDKVLNEIARVLKPGGLVVHNDAWFCRWWHEYGIVGLKKFESMSLKEKFVSIGATITEIPVLRIPPIIARRAISHFFGGKNENVPLRYSKLTPNYNLHLGCDEDAASSIDPIDVVRFYESRGFELVNKLSLKERLFFPNKYIVLRKLH